MPGSASPLTTPVQYLKGVGPVRAGALAAAGIATVEDLLYFLPRRYVDRSTVLPVSGLSPDIQATVIGRVSSVGVKRGRRPFLSLSLQDGTGILQCMWFRGTHYLRHVFAKGDLVMVSGRVGMYRRLQMTHPDYEILDHESDGDDSLNMGRIIPVYPSGAALAEARMGGKVMRRLVKTALDTCLPSLTDPLPAGIRAARGLQNLGAALTAVHFPDGDTGVSEARRRLAFDEFFMVELILALRRERIKRSGSKDRHPAPTAYPLVEPFVASLPYRLTAAQKRVLMEILRDMDSPAAMNRLLQGDVGSGKTAVALCALLRAVERGQQAALMVPTEVLAEQHYLTVRRFLAGLDITTVLVTGGRGQREAKSALATGAAQIGIGTHALFQKSVTFGNLGLAVVDEQHKFGVMQRAALYRKGAAPDVLVMTATPIPRTLSMTVYGDMDVSVIDEMPPGRGKITTEVKRADDRPKIFAGILKELDRGRQAYIIYPLVEESEKLDLAAAVESHRELSAGVFSGYACGLLHGRMTSDEKEAALAAFRDGRTSVLISTTVVEVGVDVPNATVMVIEHAERFGLAQLHQLRGRIGRGGNDSRCVLCAAPPVTADARKRLKALAGTLDGFRIAEMDLEIRGPGEFLGIRQHGLPEFRSANPVTDARLLQQARDDAFALVADDPFLDRPEHALLRGVLKRRYSQKAETA